MNLPILMYHHLEHSPAAGSVYSVSVHEFEKQMRFLRERGYQTIRFDDLYRAKGGGSALPRKSVIVSFDDGFKSFAELALPVLLSLDMVATVFVVAGKIGATNSWDREHEYATWPLPLMDEMDIRSVLYAGMAIGSHGWRHRKLTHCQPEEAREEIIRSKTKLESDYCVPVTTFGYPYGEHTVRHYPLLAEAGYQGAVCVFSSRQTVTSDFFSMRRIAIHSGDNLPRFAAKLSPLYLQYVRVRDRRRRVEGAI